ncbi:ergosterol biosynthesis ERG4/ERG24 [Zychaea mexicana]|uniref:ergosterol biosynthesis ERG4/ERG24 n=1 Tax=Zychaea mexicana TaxID=64656 RepID=UPI0022FEC36C|nr:ergosterol biosynthesis ERG4/ERG24 [Zychaea mexicana]KAI9497841.1 ergosterol biosynthesis ERG4/ERG24 [Zychaea mexicana]
MRARASFTKEFCVFLHLIMGKQKKGSASQNVQASKTASRSQPNANTGKPKGSDSDSVSVKQEPLDWKKLNPKTEHYEFGGPFGAFAMITLLPVLVLAFAFGCDSTGYDPLHRLYAFASDIVQGNFSWEMLSSLAASWKPSSLLWFLGFLAQIITYSIAMPGETVQGTKLRDGTRLTYKLNALSAAQTGFMISMLSHKSQGLYAPLWVYHNFPHLAVASLIVAFAVSIGVYVASFIGKPRLLALGGNTGNPIYDFMIGRELNPRIGNFDLKFFTELRPGLLGWLVIDICMAFKQYATLNRVTNSMILVVAFQAIYVLDALYNEVSILTTMDITTDGFGFMLAFGNLCWVPMMYSLQARYLADFPVDLPIISVIAIVGIEVLGLYIFRSANSEKDKFRTNPNDPSVKDLKYIETKAGSRLITSGWWGKARHINYLGDWLMSIAWCLPCGFNSVIPYFYCIYFAILLIHRERRDDDKCRKKYGEDWEKYCSTVKYRIIPGIY